MPRLALTTTLDRSLCLRSYVSDLGLRPVVLPCIEVAAISDETTRKARELASRADSLMLTSPRTVHLLWPGGGMPSISVAAVGEATARAAKSAGGNVVVVGESGSRDLVARLGGAPGQIVFFPHAAGTDKTVIEPLIRSGATVRSEVVYQTRPVAPDQDPVDAVVFASPSAVTGWSLRRKFGDVVIGVIGTTTAEAVAERGATHDVMGRRRSFGELIRNMAEHLKERSAI